MFITARRSAEQLDLELTGSWRATEADAIEAELRAVDFAGATRARLAIGSASLDLSGAWLLHDFLDRARKAGVAAALQGARAVDADAGGSHATGEVAGPRRATSSGSRRSVAVEGHRPALRARLAHLRRPGLEFRSAVSAGGCCSALVQPRQLRPVSPSRAISTTPASPRSRSSR